MGTRMVPDMPNSEDAASRGATAMRQVGFEVNGPGQQQAVTRTG